MQLWIETGALKPLFRAFSHCLGFSAMAYPWDDVPTKYPLWLHPELEHELFPGEEGGGLAKVFFNALMGLSATLF